MSVTERKVEWHPKTLKSICQIPKDGLEFAHVSEEYKQVHQLVWCKDFMQDAIFAFINQTPIEIYGFRYNPAEDPPVCLTKARMLICNWRDQSFEQKVLKNCREFLNCLESQLKMKKTIFEKCINPPTRYRKAGVFIVEGSKRWISSPPMVSLYTLLIRIGLVHPPGQSAHETLFQIQADTLHPYNWQPDKETNYGTGHTDNDADFLRAGREGLDKILHYGDRRIFHRSTARNYPSKLSTYQIHDGCGLRAFSSGRTKTHFPHWHRLER